MSYPYGQFPDNYSTPSTPHDAFPTWETVEHEQIRQQQQQPQQQPQQQQFQQQDLHSPLHHTPQTYQTIQLEETDHIQPLHDVIELTRVQQLQSLHPRTEGRSETPRMEEIKPILLNIDTTRSVGSSSSSTSQPIAGPSSSTGVRRSNRSTQGHQQAHPYKRSASSLGTSRPPQTREPFVRFVEHRPPGSSMPSPIVPSPASGSRITSFGSMGNSPVTNMPPLLASSPRPGGSENQQLPRKRFVIRADVHYDLESRALIAMLELPGVKKSDVRVTLSTCYYNRVRQVTVRGHSRPVFPLPAESGGATGAGAGANAYDLTVRERRFGEFTRTFVVPSDIKREDIDASMEDGVLTLKIPCGMPTEAEDAQEVLIR